MPADSARAELRDIIDRTFVGDLAGRATAERVRVTVWADLPDHLRDYLIGKGLASEIQSYFRTRSRDGLPMAPEVNEAGEHVQLEFLSVTEYAFLYSKYVDRSEANADQATKVRQRCLDLHRVDLINVVTTA